MSWDQLLSIIQNARQEDELQRTRIPAACPNDGEVLESGPNGELHCRFDGWIWDGINS
jgi:hypothetical protein